MNKARVEAFSDGVIAIIITIMVLEFKVPKGDSLADLVALWPTFLSYVLSFANVGIYWNNHHHLFHAAKKVNGTILWANLHLLFWLSMMPFTTAWMGENHFTSIPVTIYAGDLALCALAYTLLQSQIVRLQGKSSLLSRAVGRDLKGKLSLVAYLLAIPLAWFNMPGLAGALIVAVACLWFIPDRRIEAHLSEE